MSINSNRLVYACASQTHAYKPLVHIHTHAYTPRTSSFVCATHIRVAYARRQTCQTHVVFVALGFVHNRREREGTCAQRGSKRESEREREAARATDTHTHTERERERE